MEWKPSETTIIQVMKNTGTSGIIQPNSVLRRRPQAVCMIPQMNRAKMADHKRN